jgi:hypothetical protein
MENTVFKSFIGKKIELIRTTDPFTSLKPGDRGVVESVDGIGTVHVKWENGSCLGLVADAGDRWKLAE